MDWDFNSWFAQPNMPCPTRFEHEHIQTWLLLLNMRDDLHPIDTIRLLAVIKHYVDTWFLYIWYGFKKSPLTKTQQRISCKVNHESSICGADDQAESPLADSRPASHHKLCQPLQLTHPPGQYNSDGWFKGTDRLNHRLCQQCKSHVCLRRKWFFTCALITHAQPWHK